MPLYTYWCPYCDTDQEKQCRIADRDYQKCNECGNKIIRAIDIPGGVYSPTSSGGTLKV